MALDINNNITINWPCDCNQQAGVWKTMLADIEAQDTFINANQRNQLQIFSASAPSTAQWQTLWLTQGNVLPLPTGLECLWFDTSQNTYGAQFYVVDGIPYPVEMIRYRGLHSVSAIPRTVNNMGVNCGNGGTGIARWDITVPNAASWDWEIPAHLLGKNYFVKFSVPMAFNVAVTAFWTIWYENTNLYNTLYGGLGGVGFGTWTPTPVLPLMTSVEWVQEIPSGGSYPYISIRVGASSASWNVRNWPFDASNTGAYKYMAGKATAEFILKTE